MSDDPVRIVRRYYDDVFGRRDLAALDELIAPDFVGYSPGFGTFTIDDMRRSIDREFADMPEDETIVEEQFGVGDRVATRWRYRWRHTTSLFGEPPSREWIEMEGIHLDRVANGKIVERWEIKDFMGVVKRLGGTVTVAGAPDDAR